MRLDAAPVQRAGGAGGQPRAEEQHVDLQQARLLLNVKQWETGMLSSGGPVC